VLEKLNQLSNDGTTYFTFEEKFDESFESVVMASKFKMGNSAPTEHSTPEKMKLLAWGGGKICHNPGCSVVQDLKKCSVCEVARYCSRKCQLAHWKPIHKAECSKPHK
jgi:hypothetical protein